MRRAEAAAAVSSVWPGEKDDRRLQDRKQRGHEWRGKKNRIRRSFPRRLANEAAAAAK